MKLFLLLIPLLVIVIVAAHRILVGPDANTAAGAPVSAAASAGLSAMFGSPISRQQSSGKQH